MALDLPYGSMLKVIRPDTSYTKLGDKSDTTSIVGEIGPCSIVDSHGQYDHAKTGVAPWVATIDVVAPPDSDIRHEDMVQLPNGDKAMVVKPPERPVNPFTGWTPFIRFTLAAPGHTPAQ